MRLGFLASTATAALLAMGTCAIAQQTPEALPITVITAEHNSRPASASVVIPAQCTSCGGMPPRGELPPPPPSTGCSPTCTAGGHCERCEADTGFGRLYCHLYNAFQCPDPCYEPRWVAGANAALFVDSARPKNQMRFRWDYGNDLIFPDRSEYFWARIGGKGPGNPERNVDYQELTVYMEAGAERFSVFTEMPYRSLKTEDNGGGAGFGDLVIGSKTLLIDTEYVQLTFQFKTFMPIASPGKGVGVGHLSLEPSLLIAAKLTPDTYFQGQLSEWAPIGGDPGGAGALLHYHGAINHVMARPYVDSQFIATLEANGYCFQDGTFTDPFTGEARRSAGGQYLGIGPGFRWVMSDRCDFGFGVSFAVTSEHFANQLYRTELRVRF